MTEYSEIDVKKIYGNLIFFFQVRVCTLTSTATFCRVFFFFLETQRFKWEDTATTRLMSDSCFFIFSLLFCRERLRYYSVDVMTNEKAPSSSALTVTAEPCTRNPMYRVISSRAFVRANNYFFFFFLSLLLRLFHLFKSKIIFLHTQNKISQFCDRNVKSRF